MTIISPTPRFSGKFTFSQPTDDQKQQLQGFQKANNHGQTTIDYLTNTPTPGDVSMTVKGDTRNQTSLLETALFSVARQFGIKLGFEPDPPITQQDREDAGKRILDQVKQKIKALGIQMPPGSAEPTVRINGSHIEIEVEDGLTHHAVNKALGELIKEGVIKSASQGSHWPTFEEHPISSTAKVDSEYARQLMQNMLD